MSKKSYEEAKAEVILFDREVCAEITSGIIEGGDTEVTGNGETTFHMPYQYRQRS